MAEAWRGRGTRPRDRAGAPLHRNVADAGGHRGTGSDGRGVVLPAPLARACGMFAHAGRPPAHPLMGIHFFRPDLLGISAPPNLRVTGTGTHTGFRRPSILIYEPQRDGSLALVAVENLVFKEAWHAAGHAERPSFRGVPYDDMADDPTTPIDEAHQFAPHYDRHVWLYRRNPNGLFAQFNPNVSCRHHTGATTHAH